jgi:hypothetical protein
MPTVTVRPDATEYNGGTLVGAATAHAALSDDSDASYVELTYADFGETVWLDFPALTLPGGARWKTYTLRARARASGSGRQAFLGAGEPGSAVTFAVFVGGSFATITSGPQPFAGFSPHPEGGVSSTNDGSGQDILVAELYFDAVYASAPTCSVTAPTGTVTDTTKPAIQWVHTPGADGGAQSAAEVKVFNAAQYGAAGFSPDTSTPFWSTTAGGGVNAATPDVQLVDDDYRAYVRTAQSVNGSPHWSSWDFEAFTVDSDPPPAPTISATGDDANARTRLVVTIDGAEASIAAVERSVDGGATWVDVRGYSRKLVAGDTLIAYDYESPNGEAASFRAQAIRETANGDIASDWSSPAAATWSSPYTWLKNIRNPALSRTFRFRTMPTWERARPQGVHAVVDDEFPAVISGRLQAVAGEAVLLTESLAERDAVLTLLAGEVILVQPPANHGVGSRYFAPGRVTERRIVRIAGVAYRELAVQVTEVPAPADTGIDGFVGTTYADVAATYSDYADLLASVANYGALL